MIGGPAFSAVPAVVHPGGTPSVGEGELDRNVDKAPSASVLVTVVSGTMGATVGIAVAFTTPSTRIGLYVLVASALSTILPMEAGTDVLNAYEGVGYESVESGKSGRVVAIVTDAEDRKADTALGDSVNEVVLLRG